MHRYYINTSHTCKVTPTRTHTDTHTHTDTTHINNLLHTKTNTHTLIQTRTNNRVCVCNPIHNILFILYQTWIVLLEMYLSIAFIYRVSQKVVKRCLKMLKFFKFDVIRNVFMSCIHLYGVPKSCKARFVGCLKYFDISTWLSFNIPI